MTISCIEEIYKKYVAIARAENPGMFLKNAIPPHTMRHTTATHMLEAGIPMMAIKNFLGAFLNLYDRTGTLSFHRGL